MFLSGFRKNNKDNLLILSKNLENPFNKSIYSPSQYSKCVYPLCPRPFILSLFNHLLIRFDYECDHECTFLDFFQL